MCVFVNHSCADVSRKCINELQMTILRYRTVSVEDCLIYLGHVYHYLNNQKNIEIEKFTISKNLNDQFEIIKCSTLFIYNTKIYN